MENIWSLGVFLIPIVAIAGGILAGIVHTITRGRVRELEIRERIAMIERGVVPPPESDPEGFDRGIQSMRELQRSHIAPRHRSAGIILISIGLGLAVLLTFAGGVPREGIGVGGFIVILGLGFVINGLFGHHSAPSTPPSSLPGPPGPPRAQDPAPPAARS